MCINTWRRTAQETFYVGNYDCGSGRIGSMKWSMRLGQDK